MAWDWAMRKTFQHTQSLQCGRSVWSKLLWEFGTKSNNPKFIRGLRAICFLFRRDVWLLLLREQPAPRPTTDSCPISSSAIRHCSLLGPCTYVSGSVNCSRLVVCCTSCLGVILWFALWKQSSHSLFDLCGLSDSWIRELDSETEIKNIRL